LIGVYKWQDGREYNGQWKYDKKNGRGIYKWPDGSNYDGKWIDDKREGKGVYYDGAGKSLEGVWVKDLMHGIFNKTTNGNADGIENWYYGKKKK